MNSILGRLAVVIFKGMVYTMVIAMISFGSFWKFPNGIRGAAFLVKPDPPQWKKHKNKTKL